MPLFVALVLSLQQVEVKLETVSFGSSRSEVGLHAEVKARLKANLGFFHVVVEVFVEVGQRFIVQLALFHAVLKHYASC